MKIVTFLVLLIGFNSMAQTENYWVKKNDFTGLKRERTSSFVIQNTAYVYGGIDTTEVSKSDLWKYNTQLDTWTQLADLPGSSRRDAIAFSLNDLGYIGLGMDSSSATNGNLLKDLWQYNPTTNTWLQKADFPGATGNGIYFATSFALDNKGYVCGGKYGPSQYTNQLWEYKPANDSWTQRKPYPGGIRYQLSSFTIGQFAYVGLGTDQNFYKKDFYRYSPGNNTWIQIQDFGGGERGSASAFSIQERGFICLGTNGGLRDDLWSYSPYTNQWTQKAFYGGSSRKGAFAFVIRDTAYVGTGKGVSGKKESIHAYIPNLVLGENTLEVSSVQIFPNPFMDFIQIRNAENSQWMLYNTAGELVKTFEVTSNAMQIEMNDLPKGIYYLHKISPQKENQTYLKLIKC